MTIFRDITPGILLPTNDFLFSNLGFGDFVPGDAVLNVDAENGQAKLLLAVVYVLMGLAVVAMTINLVQEEIIERFRQLAIDIGIIDDDEDIEDDDII